MDRISLPVAFARLGDRALHRIGASSSARITVSKETTYFTEPLQPDGYVDYVAALNQRCSDGVTPENNAAVLFWQAFGPSGIPYAQRDTHFEMLGIPSPPADGDYFVTSIDFVNRLKDAGRPEAQPRSDGMSPIDDQLVEAMKRPGRKPGFRQWPSG